MHNESTTADDNVRYYADDDDVDDEDDDDAVVLHPRDDACNVANVANERFIHPLLDLD